MCAANKILNKLVESCANTSNDTAILMMTFKLYLSALSGYCKFSEMIESEIIECVTDAQVCVINWISKSDTGLGDCFGGKNGKKMRSRFIYKAYVH